MDESPQKTFISHAKLIGVITFASRIVGLAREMVGAYFFGANAIWAAWKVAFTVPNLFRKLFGEGALSAAFIPLYAQALKGSGVTVQGSEQESGVRSQESAGSPESIITPVAVRPDARPDVHVRPDEFAAASVNLLVGILIVLTIVGELILFALASFAPLRPDHLLAVKLSMIMLPYVLLVCGTAFLSAILQVHARFAAAAATSIVLNVCLIVAIVIAARWFDLKSETGQISAVTWLSWAVLISGAVQVLMLLPSLHAAGFRFRLAVRIWTPAVRRMLKLTGPVALGAAVLQIGVLMDKGIGIALAEAPDQTTMRPFGHEVRLPMAEGAAARLDLAQFMYQFPLGVFAIALATAIFPKLSSEVAERNGTGPISPSQKMVTVPGFEATEEFRAVLRRGIDASLFIGLPASAGMILVAAPAARLLFQHGQFTAADAAWVALSTAIYSAAVWAFSLLQIINRAFYALHDASTPLKWVAINLLLNLIIELPLLWTPLRESAMAVGTLVSFTIQAIAMLWILSRRTGGLGLRQIAPNIGKMLIATIIMTAACVAIVYSPIYPQGDRKITWAIQLGLIMLTGGVVYFGACAAMGLGVVKHLKRR